jgi:hypothetical protein
MSQDEHLKHLEALGVGYTRMEQCVMELCKAIHLLVEQNAVLLKAIAEHEAEQAQAEEEAEPVGYLSLKRR